MKRKLKVFFLDNTVNRYTILAITGLLAVTLLFMLPRLISAQFGLLDDGVSVVMSKVLIDKPIDAFKFQRSNGRFYPIYWLYLSYLLKQVDYSPLGGFWANWFMLFGTVLGIFAFLRWRNCSHFAAFMAGFFYCLSAASIENYYTLSKPEPIQIFCIVIGLCLLALSSKTLNKYVKYLLYFLAGFAFWLAFHTKETTVVLFGISFAWSITAWYWKFRRSKIGNQDDNGMDFSQSRTMFIIISVVFLSWIVNRTYFLGGLTGGGYSTNYQLSYDSIKNQSWRWIGYLLRDYLYLLPLVAVTIVPSLWQLVSKQTTSF